MIHSICSIRYVRWFCLLIVYLLGTDIGTDRAFAESAVHVSRAHQFDVSEKYETILSRLDGIEPAKRMFLSQGVRLLSYTPREPSPSESSAKSANESQPPQKADSDTNRAVIDISAYSSEHGFMAYTMTIEASKTVTQIDVSLNCPAGMVVGQHYRFTIEPKESDVCSIGISHSLMVHLMQRKLEVVNRVIKQVTCEESLKQVRCLTQAMVLCVSAIVSPNAEASAGTKSESTSSPETSEPPKESPSKNDAEQSDSKPTTQSEAADRESSVPSGETALDESKPKLTFKVKLDGTGKGAVRLAIFQSKEQFDKFDARKPEKDQGEAFRKLEVSVSQDKKDHVECVFDDVPFGKYVVAAFYDKDSNKRLNASFVGLPSEPYGFSKDARGTLGPPKYEDAEIGFDKDHTQFSFTLK